MRSCEPSCTDENMALCVFLGFMTWLFRVVLLFDTNCQHIVKHHTTILENILGDGIVIELPQDGFIQRKFITLEDLKFYIFNTIV